MQGTPRPIVGLSRGPGAEGRVGREGSGALLRDISEGQRPACLKTLLATSLQSTLAISTSQNNSFPQMLIAERDKKRIEISICPPGMEVIKLTPQSLRYLMSFVKHYFFKKTEQSM